MLSLTYSVFLEESALTSSFVSLTLQGEQTPDVAPWQRLPLRSAGASSKGAASDRFMCTYVLRVMNHEQYEHVLFRDPRTHKKMFFYADLNEFDVVS